MHISRQSTGDSMPPPKQTSHKSTSGQISTTGQIPTTVTNSQNLTTAKTGQSAPVNRPKTGLSSTHSVCMCTCMCVRVHVACVCCIHKL